MSILTACRYVLITLIVWLSLVVAAHAATVTCSGPDDTAALQSAINANEEVYILGDCFAGNLTTPGPRYIHGNVASSITFLTGYTGFLLDAGTNRLVLRDITLNGQSTVGDFRQQVTAVSSRSALLIDAVQDNLIENVRFNGFDSYCLAVWQSGPTFTPRTALSNLYATRCLEAYSLGGEFVRHSNLSATQTSVALAIRAGNTLGAGCHLIDNRINLYIVGLGAGTQNDGHGSVSACEMAHSTIPVSEQSVPGFNVYAHSVVQGFVISGSQIHAGNIRLEFSTGIVITGSEIQVGWIMLIGGGCNLITDTFFFENAAIGLTNNVEHNFLGYPDSTVLKNNIEPYGWFPQSVGSANACPL